MGVKKKSAMEISNISLVLILLSLGSSCTRTTVAFTSLTPSLSSRCSSSSSSIGIVDSSTDVAVGGYQVNRLCNRVNPSSNNQNSCRNNSSKNLRLFYQTEASAAASSEDKSSSSNDIISNAAHNNNGSRQLNDIRTTRKENNRVAGGKNNNRRGFKNGKIKNDPNMSDPHFLRKRTENILSITSEENYSLDGDDDGDDDSHYMIGKVKADTKAFNWLIDAWAFSGQREAPENANKLLMRMEKLYEDKDLNKNNVLGTVRPDVKTYTKVMNTLSRSGRPDSGVLAEKVLKRMEYLHESNQNNMTKPNHFTYTVLLEAHANSCSVGSAQRAEEIFSLMEKKYIEGDLDLRPKGRDFHALINAHAKSGDAGAARRAEECIDRMYEEKNPNVRPNTYHFNSVINAYAKSNEEGSALRAEEVLARIERLNEDGEDDVEPTTVGFNAVIDAWAKSGDENAAERAEDLLRHMEYLYQEGGNRNCKPNTRSFNAVINAWAKSGRDDAAYKAEEVLMLMQKLQDAGDDDIKPDVHSFSTAINAWARSHVEGKAERAYNLLREMKKVYRSGRGNRAARPNIVVYNAVMNACAFTSGGILETNKALEIAHGLLRELDQSTDANPDHVTYGTFFKVVSNQMPDCKTRNQVIELLFRKCCKDGQVSNFVINQLRNVRNEELYEKLVGHPYHEEINVGALPKAWSCNVVDGKWRRSRRLRPKSKK